MTDERLLPVGRYRFKITHADCGYISNAGNPCVKLILEISYMNKIYKIWEFMTKNNNADTGLPWEFIEKKINELFKSIGKQPVLLNSAVNDDLLDGEGYVIIKLEESDQYGTKNRVDRFLPKEKDPMASRDPADPRKDSEIPELNDECPF